VARKPSPDAVGRVQAIAVTGRAGRGGPPIPNALGKHRPAAEHRRRRSVPVAQDLREKGLVFGRWRLQTRASRLLTEAGTEAPLGSRAFDLLLALVEADGAVVSKDALMARVWPGTIVEENNLQVQVSALRKVLADDAARLIATIPGRGYRFTGTVQLAAAAPPSAAAADGAPPRSGRPMLVVLPFANMTGDAQQDYFADGMTEDLTTALSHARWFSVIARNSAFTYKGRAVDVRQVGHELGVGYVLEGSVRRAGGKVRISAQLCEAESGRHVWAQRFDGDLADIFDLQDRVVEAVAGAIEPSLRMAEVERIRPRPTESLGAYDLYLRALPHRSSTCAGNDEVVRLLRRALALDPGFAAAKGLLAGQMVLRVTQGWAGRAKRRRRSATPARWWGRAARTTPPRSPGRGTRSPSSPGTTKWGWRRPTGRCCWRPIRGRCCSSTPGTASTSTPPGPRWRGSSARCGSARSIRRCSTSSPRAAPRTSSGRSTRRRWDGSARRCATARASSWRIASW
jgi:TolB-like protein